MPGLLPLLYTLFMYYMLDKKKVGSVTLIVMTMVAEYWCINWNISTLIGGGIMIIDYHSHLKWIEKQIPMMLRT